MSLNNMWSNIFCLFCMVICTLILETTAFVGRNANQTSTNGSHEAFLGCDGNMDTFSLTADTNSWWFMELNEYTRIVWMYVSIGAGSYEITIRSSGGKFDSCANIDDAHIMKKIITCSSSNVNSGNGILIKSKEQRPMQIYEVEIIGISQIDKKLIKNFTDSWNTISQAMDNDLDTFYSSDENSNASWVLSLDAPYLMKWFLIYIRGGTFELHITTGYVKLTLSTLCKRFNLPGIKKQQTALQCDKGMHGDTLVVQKMDEGTLRIFEFIPIICPFNHFGPNCAKCRQRCRSCDPITGKCTQCQSSSYGDDCQHSCPPNCLDLICDHVTGACNGCKNGFIGKNCELTVKMTSLIFSIGADITSSSDKTTHFSLKGKTNHETTRDGVDQVLLWYMLVILTILVAVGAILFVLKTKKENPIEEKLEENGFAIEFHRGISMHESDFVEIVENDPDDEEDEVITVEYNNLTSQRVSINQFIENLTLKKNNGALEGEFDDLPFGLLESYSNALKSCNRKKNRYKGIYPYDHNCVKLRTDDDGSEGYVNASYIHGYEKEKAYIAAQGPFNQQTLEDFWGLVWQNECTRIVMLTNLYEGDKMKCLKYWQDTDIDIGPFAITLDTEDVNEQYILRYMIVKYQDEVRRVTQFHFTAWPDNSVPEDVTSLITFRNLVRDGMTSSDGPIVVHCSAGIGRTGTFIALDYLLEEGAVEETVDIKGYVISLRHQRGKSIQTFEQYVFLHDALVEGLTNNMFRKSCLSVL